MKLRITLDRDSDTPLNRQLYDKMTRLILAGSLESGSKLPSTRELSVALGISRPTVVACLEQLAQEGYVEVKPGSGSYVCRHLNQQALQMSGKTRLRRSRSSSVSDYRLSEYGGFVSKIPDLTSEKDEPEISFYCWRPALDQFPLTEWARILGRHARSSSLSMLDTCRNPQATLELRQALASMVERFRAVSCHPDQIIPVTGLNQGLDLVARLHLSAGSRALVEDPGFAPVAFRGCGARMVPVQVDADGMRVDLLKGKAFREQIDLAYLTPAHQFPTGAVMSLSRRLAFLKWARACGTLVLEDDYDSEYQATGQPIPALMSLDRDQRVIYLGTLNQLMFPSLGLAYLIVPPPLVPLYRQARNLAGEQLSPPLQAAVAEFLNQGHLDRHVRKLRCLYRVRRDVLVQALKRRFGDLVSIGPARRGVFILVRFDLGINDDQLIERAARVGVGLTSTSGFYMSRACKEEFIMGFGSLDQSQIEEGVRKLASALKV